VVGGALVYFLRVLSSVDADFRALASDGDFQIREYPAMSVAETVVYGPRKEALDGGFRALADYIFAKTRDGEQLPMTVPVMQDAGDPMASDPPLFDDELEGGWRTRFVMPAGRSKANLPAPAEGVELVELEPRRVGVVSFAGRPGDRGLAEQEDRLRGWLARHGESSEAEPEYAFYNSPVIPGPLRRNEVWLGLN
jgi:hypothetical protein